MKAYRIVNRSDSRSLAEYLTDNGQILLPMVELIEGCGWRIGAIAPHWESYSLWCSNTIRTARSRTSGEYLLGLPMMTPILSSNGVSGKPGAVQLQAITLV